MQTIDITALERKLRARHLVEPTVRAFNGTAWLLYWIALPVFAVAVVFVIVMVLLRQPADLVLVVGVLVGILVAGLVHYGSLRAIFGFERGWAWLGCVGYGAITVVSAVELVQGAAAWFARDQATFVHFVTLQALATAWLLAMGLANLAVLRLTPQERRMLRPATRPRMFPRRRFRSLTFLPDVLDYVPSRWTRGWIATLYVVGVAFFLVVPYNMTQGAHTLQRAEQASIQACSAADERERCVAREMQFRSLAGMATLPLSVTFCLVAAGWLLRRAQRRLTFSLEHVVQLDARPPVLFLRPFGDDHVRLPRAHRAPLRWLFRGALPVATLEQLVLERFTRLGPVVAIGNPADTAVPFGAARSYLSTDEWRARVARLIGDARCIVICLDASHGLLWEFEQIIASGQQDKCIFIVHPRLRGRDDNRALMRSTLDRLLPATASPAAGTPEAPVLGWRASGGEATDIVRSATFSEAAFEVALSWLSGQVSQQAPSAARGDRHHADPGGLLAT